MFFKMLSFAIINNTTNNTKLLSKSQLQLCDYFNALFDACEMQDTITVDLTTLQCNQDIINSFLQFIENPVKENVPKLNASYYQLVDIAYYFGCNLLLHLIDEEIETYTSYYQYKEPISTEEDIPINKIEDHIMEDFLHHIYDYYKCFKLAHQLSSFHIITNRINLTIGKKYSLQELGLNSCLISLDEFNDIISSIIYRIDDHLMYNLYEYPTIIYKKIDCQVYKTDVIANPNYGMEAVDYTQSFEDKLNAYTNDIFKHFNWDNIIMAGGFPFALVNNVNNAFIDSTDIDLFIHHKDVQVRADTYSNVLYYFYQLGCNFLNAKGIISILVPNVKYPIQLILSEHDPITIIEDFDLNYVKLYYDGYNLKAHIQCIYALTYQTAVHDNIIYSNYLEKRLYKTIQKNLLIKYNEIYEHRNKEYVYQEQEKEYIEYEEINWNNLCFHYLTYHSDEDAYYYILNNDNMNRLKILPPTKQVMHNNIMQNNMFYIQHVLKDKACIPMFQLEYTKISITNKSQLSSLPSLMFTITKNMEQIINNYYQHIQNITKHLGKYMEYQNMHPGVIFVNEQYINKKYLHFIETLVKYNTNINSDHLSILIKPVLIYRRLHSHHITLKFELVHVKKI